MQYSSTGVYPLRVLTTVVWNCSSNNIASDVEIDQAVLNRVRGFESELYEAAASLEEYCDMATLNARLGKLSTGDHADGGGKAAEPAGKGKGGGKKAAKKAAGKKKKKEKEKEKAAEKKSEQPLATGTAQDEALYMASKGNCDRVTADVPEVQRLLVAGANPNAYVDNHGNHALNVASMGGHNEAVLLLLEAGADAAVADEDGDTALLIAAGMGWPRTLVILLRAGAQLDVENGEGNTALAIAQEGDYIKCVTVLEEAKEMGAEAVAEKYKRELPDWQETPTQPVQYTYKPTE